MPAAKHPGSPHPCGIVINALSLKTGAPPTASMAPPTTGTFQIAATTPTWQGVYDQSVWPRFNRYFHREKMVCILKPGLHHRVGKGSSLLWASIYVYSLK